MASQKKVLAFDYGASSGRAMVGGFDGGKITLEEIHRFANDPVRLSGTLYWDTPRQVFELKQGILKCFRAGGADSIGIDTWGVDFGLLDAKGYLLENHVHYRDTRTRGIIPQAAAVVPVEEIYGITGTQFMEFNTLFQLYYLRKNRPELLERADALLMTPDLFAYFLTGEKHTEYTIASTTQLLDAAKRGWSRELMERFGLPARLFRPIVAPGTAVGSLSAEVCEELGVPAAKVVAVAEHDTASAVAAVPARGENFAYLSSGTWSLLGTETDAPVIGEASRALNFTNEGGCGGKIRYLKNIIGLWLIQESRRQWQREGAQVSFAELEAEAAAAPAFGSFIDPDAPEFVAPGDIPGRIREFCARTGQKVPQSRGEVMRCVYESLALKYRFALGGLERSSGRRFDTLHVIGGGTKDRFLCRLTAGAIGRPVVAGPVEATVLGNIAVQLIAAGEFASLTQARQAIAASFPPARFEPEQRDAWDDAAGRFEKILAAAAQ